MVASLKILAARIYLSIQQRGYLFEPRIFAFSVIAVLCFPLYYLIWHDLFPQPYENLDLRLIGSAVFFPLVFAGRWPGWLRRYQPIYWYLALLYALPFFFTFMLLKNGGSTVWLLSTLIAVFLMVLLLDWRNILIHFAVGVSLAWIAYYTTTDVPHMAFITLESLPIFIFAIILGSITNYSSEILQRERLRAMLAAASNIAHELRTPLLGIKGGAVGLQRYLPTLLNAYRLAQERGLVVEPIRLAHLHAMHGVLTRIEDEVDHSNTVIDMLLMNSRPSGISPENFSDCSVAQCIRTAIDRYPFASDKERQLILWDNKADFRFRGIELLMVHVLFNLMKNALYHVAKAGKGTITISLETTPHDNMLIFRDSGSGIPQAVMPHIFTRFYSWSADSDGGLGAGIGLAFCSSVMESFGGSIRCDSQEGDYTEFVMTFPSIAGTRP
jgi:signal transduction histidine kinase